MATITATLAPAMGNSQRGRNPYMVEQVVDLTANSINPNGDVVQCITVPANTKILAAGFQVTKSATQNTGTDATAILGTGADDNEYVTAFDIDGAADGAYAPSVTVSARLTPALFLVELRLRFSSLRALSILSNSSSYLPARTSRAY